MIKIEGSEWTKPITQTDDNIESRKMKLQGNLEGKIGSTYCTDAIWY